MSMTMTACIACGATRDRVKALRSARFFQAREDAGRLKIAVAPCAAGNVHTVEPEILFGVSCKHVESVGDGKRCGAAGIAASLASPRPPPPVRGAATNEGVKASPHTCRTLIHAFIMRSIINEYSAPAQLYPSLSLQSLSHTHAIWSRSYHLTRPPEGGRAPTEHKHESIYVQVFAHITYAHLHVANASLRGVSDPARTHRPFFQRNCASLTARSSSAARSVGLRGADEYKDQPRPGKRRSTFSERVSFRLLLSRSLYILLLFGYSRDACCVIGVQSCSDVLDTLPPRPGKWICDAAVSEW